MKTRIPLLLFALVAELPAAQAEGQVNVYTSCKEALIRPLLDRFTESSGIEVRVLSANAGALLSRLQREGRNSPADLLLTVDAGNLSRAKEAGVLQSLQSEFLDTTIPDTYRDPEGYWYGLSQRARVIFRSKGRVAEDALDSYADLSDPVWRGKVCIRSSDPLKQKAKIYDRKIFQAHPAV